ncbi:transforming acidic coiled-coil-containing protein 1-like isoform X2 [Brienomyrus brachyistius]|uniref:transforming acidic coiled-coil-containing protein 1-like isoform X2 n=1 Tax=Brienomyrus brachyistius TaxID=42636 RepID=UPI0020B238E4|nr:transforming acidic coiled-coil-containing protein 1-like isoform X2 [Brienomyrus brachyistius]
MSWLSPVQWAKWTWSAVRGGEEGEEAEEEEEEGGQGAEGEPKEEVFFRDKKSPGGSSDSEGHFETPEAESPVHSGGKGRAELEDQARDSPDIRENVQQLISDSVVLPNPSVNESANDELSLVPPAGLMGDDAREGEAVGVLSSMEGDQKTPTGMETPSSPISQLKPPSNPVEVGDKELCNGHTEVKSNSVSKARPPSLKIPCTRNGPSQGDVEDEIPISKSSYNFDPDLYNDSINPFNTGSSKVRNSPPPCSVNTGEAEVAGDLPLDAKPVAMEFGVEDNGEIGVAKKPIAQRKPGKKPSSKVTPKRQKPKPVVPAPESAPEPSAPTSLDEVPIPETSYNPDPSQWDDPNFNPFGGNSRMSGSPVLPKGSYSFDPNNFDDSVDPFKPSKNMAVVAPTSMTKRPDNELESRKVELPLEEEVKGSQSPKKNKGRMITGACKVKKYDNQALVLDICGEEDEPVVSQNPITAHSVGHATDEEKLASTTTGQKPGKANEEKNGTEEAVEAPQVGVPEDLESKGSCHPYEDPCRTQSPKLTDSEDPGKGSPVLDSICISEADKAAVLALIREEIITKEIEVNEWKRKYEESRQEVMEMRKIVAEYENTIAQMIEDEQRCSSGSRRSIQQVTVERDQALADLNSVERSLSDLFRRYENMKTVLEGFKKNEEVLKKCAQEYLARVKQEEQRYQTLKIHAEEKLEKANDEIAQVRAKANSESVALHASLRKEQMKVDSLERALHQKNQEIEELTKICDELIAKLGKVD